MKLYYIQTDELRGLQLPSVWLDHNNQKQEILIRSIPDKPTFPRMGNTINLKSNSGRSLIAYDDPNASIMNLNLLHEAQIGRMKRHDRQFWLVWCSVLVPEMVFGPVPYYQMATGSKLGILMSAVYHARIELFSFCSPFANSTFEECFCILIAKDLVVTGDSFEIVTDHGFENTYDLRESLFPCILLTSSGTLTPTQPAVVTVSVVDADGNLHGGDMEIWFETVNGYLPYTRSRTINGTTSIPVMALGMKSGDAIRVKAGTKFVTGLADITLIVEGD